MKNEYDPYLCGELNDGGEEADEECGDVNHLDARGEHGEEPGRGEGRRHQPQRPPPTVPDHHSRAEPAKERAEKRQARDPRTLRYLGISRFRPRFHHVNRVCQKSFFLGSHKRLG